MRRLATTLQFLVSPDLRPQLAGQMGDDLIGDAAGIAADARRIQFNLYRGTDAEGELVSDPASRPPGPVVLDPGLTSPATTSAPVGPLGGGDTSALICRCATSALTRSPPLSAAIPIVCPPRRPR